MWRYFELLSFRPTNEIQSLRRAIADGRNPMEVKFELASELVARFHDAGAAERAKSEFIARHRNRETPEDLELTVVTSATPTLGIVYVLTKAGSVEGTTEARRLIEQGAVSKGDERITDPKTQIRVGDESVYKIGKRRFWRIRVDEEKNS